MHLSYKLAGQVVQVLQLTFGMHPLVAACAHTNQTLLVYVLWCCRCLLAASEVVNLLQNSECNRLAHACVNGAHSHHCLQLDRAAQTHVATNNATDDVCQLQLDRVHAYDHATHSAVCCKLTLKATS